MSEIQDHAERVSREIALEDYHANIEEARERIRYQTDFAQSALKNLHLVNGGAILALLTLLGNTGIEFNHRAIWWGFFWFGTGLASSIAAYFGAYFSQAYYMEVTIKQAWNAQRRARGGEEPYDFQSEFRVGNRFMYSGIGAAVASLASFVIGAFVALSGLQ